MAELYLSIKIYKMIQQKKLLFGISMLLLAATLVSCDPQKRINKDFNYFQKGLDSVQSVGYVEPKLHENDLITVQVIAGSLRQEDAALFNLSSTTSAASNTTTATQAVAAGYQIDMLGNIEMPKIGKIKAAGLTKQELASSITAKLVDEVKNPLVIVKLAAFKVNVLGEVRKPGVVSFRADKANILDAIAEAGDLTESGKREDVLVMRQVNGKYETYKIDLRSAAFINSPAFQMQQNDVIYVGANINKLKAVNVNPNFQRDYSLALTTVSTLFLILNTITLLRSR
jgi:polysaccharide biosynthesis/export protein